MDYFAQLRWLEPAPADFRARVQTALADGQDGAALRRLAQYGMSEAQLHQLGRAYAKARAAGHPGASLTPFRLAVLSNGTTDHLGHALVATALRYGLNLEVLGLSYNEAYTAAIGGDERVAAFKPDAVLVAMDHHALPLQAMPGSAEDELQAVARCTGWLQAMFDGIRGHFGAVCIAQTVALPPGTGFGSADRRIAGTRVRVVNAVNDYLATAADALVDVATLAATVGSAQWFDPKLFNTGKIPFALPFVPLYADHVGRVLGALRGKSRRVLVLDLDNTLWGGVVGDDGVHGIVIGNGSAHGEAYLAVQRKALALRQRGVLLAVSSKNDEEQARRPFRELSDMVLKEDAFSAFHANWNDKAANIEAIAQELSLGLDSFVFLDDNPAERALVRRFLPDVAVPELPDDPSGYVLALEAAGYFEAAALSEEDLRRADLYQSRGVIARLAPNDLGGYLASLEMQLEIDPVHAGNRTRVVQLINKSNQFNLTTRRYTEAEMLELEARPDTLRLALRLKDKLDDHGIISVLLCERAADALDVSLWVMSCRVIGRGVEQAVLQQLAVEARALGCTSLRGSYLPTARNKMVEQHYAKLGFELAASEADGTTRWTLALDSWTPAQASPIRIERRV